MLGKNTAKNIVAAPDTELHDKNATSPVVPITKVVVVGGYSFRKKGILKQTEEPGNNWESSWTAGDAVESADITFNHG